MIPTGKQLREGRALVGVSQTDFADASGVDVAILIRAESEDGIPPITVYGSAKLRCALENAGVEFIGDAAHLRDPPAP